MVHLAALSAGWLGKNYALEVGASQASGDWLLFTDGDVLFGRQALRHAVGRAERERPEAIGVGDSNLVRARVCREAGGHAAFPMRPDISPESWANRTTPSKNRRAISPSSSQSRLLLKVVGL